LLSFPVSSPESFLFLPAGAAITPVTNKPVLVMGCCTTVGDQSVGQVSLLHLSGDDIAWTGVESYFPATITSGFTGAAGFYIVIDLHHQVDIRTAGADTIRVHNGSAGTVAGNVTLIW
jgi:hypothetical protein